MTTPTEAPTCPLHGSLLMADGKPCPARFHERYAEPDLGTRKEAIKALLKEGYRSPERARMNTRKTSATGLQLGDKWVSIVDVLRLVSCPPLSGRQVRIITLYFEKDHTNEQIAGMLGLSKDTVVREKNAAIGVMESTIWPYPADDEES